MDDGAYILLSRWTSEVDSFPATCITPYLFNPDRFS